LDCCQEAFDREKGKGVHSSAKMGAGYENVSKSEGPPSTAAAAASALASREPHHANDLPSDDACSSALDSAASVEADEDQQEQHIGELPKHVPFPIPKRKLVYAVILFLTLWTIELATDNSVFRTVEQHEPSIRIFRALLEMALLLAGCAVSIAVWTRYIGTELTAQLLFQPPAELFAAETGTTAPVRTVHGGSSTDDEEEDEDEEEAEIEVNGVTIIEDTSLRVPSPWMVLTGALDLLVWILVALVFYTLTAVHAVSGELLDNDVGRLITRIAAPTFPLLLFCFVAFKAVHPWRNRKAVLQIISFTLSAPGLDVTFRDGMIGDVLTSMVRPMQDVAFTVFYILFGLRGWYDSDYFFPEDAGQTEREFITGQEEQVMGSGTFFDAADANVPAMEQSWIVHTVVLPACMISPLWWRFNQNMRQTYDNQQRWPFLGNAFKYFCAASVAMTGVYHPHLKSSPVWLACFVAATLYQVRSVYVAGLRLLGSDLFCRFFRSSHFCLHVKKNRSGGTS